ncbi:MAG TPA: hypothetical protein VIE43_01150 [Thermoanaerobaculia bacterium]|jgi:multisubunit Na+/H+ antiporter MnhG subunit|nr:hypothetical protein [Thermoanaerobaculia bacterium]
MTKFLRLAGLAFLLTAAIPMLSTKPVYACVARCDLCNTWGCKSTGFCLICCAQGTPGCMEII